MTAWWVAMIFITGAVFRMDDPVGCILLGFAQFAMAFIAAKEEPSDAR